MSNNKRIKLLYITCLAHGGSTLTGRLFGHFDGFFNAGQIHGALFHRRLFRDRACGCGQLIENCEIWSKVFKKAFGGPDMAIADKIIDWNRKINDLTILKGKLSGGLRGNPWDEYIPMLDKFYQAIHEVTECRVIVDSSRIPGYAYLLSQLPSLDVYVAHIFRDPRGSLYSSQRALKKVHGADWSEFRYALNAPRNSLSVIKHYFVTSWFWRNQPDRFVRFRYNDMIANGEAELKKAFDMLGEPQSGSPFVGPSLVDLSGDHTSGGNAVRMNTGVIELKEDLAWQTNLNRRDRFVVTAMTWPIMAQHGFLRPQKNNMPKVSNPEVEV